MKPKTLIPILLALVIAIAAGSYLYKETGTTSAAVDVQKTLTIPVTVATVDLAWGTKLEAEMLKTTPFLEESLPQGSFPEPEKLVGRVLVATLTTNEPVTANKLAPEDVTIGGVSAFLAPGKRAMAVKGDKVIGLSGLIKPGNVVDVFVTVQNPRTKKETTKIVLEKIKVLATGVEIHEKDGKDEKASPYDVYTLEVTPQEGELLALAATKGKLQFALRNITDTETVLTSGTTIDQAMTSLSNAKPPAELKKKYPKRFVRRRRVTVETINGDKVTKKRF